VYHARVKQQAIARAASEIGKRVISAPLRFYLYSTAAVAGAAIMIVEILGAKMLAPYLGSSHFVWTAQIATTLAALAVGYYAGGELADRIPKPGQMYGSILLAALYLCGTLVMIGPVVEWCLGFDLAIASLLVSVLLFFPPLVLLGAATPFLVRFLTSSVSGLGSNFGRLAATGTVGSVVGTVLIGYCLIPFLPNAITMCLTAGVLMVCVMIYFICWQKGNALSVAVACVVGLLVGFYNAQARPKYQSAVELVRRDTNFGLLQMIESTDGRERWFLNDYVAQNAYDPTEHKGRLMFTYMLHGLARRYTEKVQDVLCIGLGTGIVPGQFVAEGARVDVVEINPAVLPLATRYFGLDTNGLNIVWGDGRTFLNGCTNQYDTILIDAFLGDSYPLHLMTRESFRRIRTLLKPNGTLVINTYGLFNGGKSFLFASLEKTLSDVFRSVRIHRNRTQYDLQNVFFVASDQARWHDTGSVPLEQVLPKCRSDVEAALDGIDHTDAGYGRVLTDDYNPVDYYDAPNQVNYRRSVIAFMGSL